jgi:hypothetical protein
MAGEWAAPLVHLVPSAILHDTARVALEAGNSPEVIFGHYRELVTQEAAKAWFRWSRDLRGLRRLFNYERRCLEIEINLRFRPQ